MKFVIFINFASNSLPYNGELVVCLCIGLNSQEVFNCVFVFKIVSTNIMVVKLWVILSKII